MVEQEQLVNDEWLWKKAKSKLNFDDYSYSITIVHLFDLQWLQVVQVDVHEESVEVELEEVVLVVERQAEEVEAVEMDVLLW